MSLLEQAEKFTELFGDLCKAFNPDQPRDERGRFTSGGGAAASSKTPSAKTPKAKPFHVVNELRANGEGATRAKVYDLSHAEVKAAAKHMGFALPRGADLMHHRESLISQGINYDRQRSYGAGI